MAHVGVLMAQGFEEMELVITADILRRAGAEVTLITLAPTLEPVTGSRGIRLVPDAVLSGISADRFEMIVLPGGLEGTERLGGDPAVIDLIQQMHRQNRLIAAICAAPAVLVKAGLGVGKRLTSHPAAAGHMTGVEYQTARVVTDGQVITSRAAGTTFEFAFALVERLFGPEKVREVNRGVLALLPDQLPALMA